MQTHSAFEICEQYRRERIDSSGTREYVTIEDHRAAILMQVEMRQVLYEQMRDELRKALAT